MHKQITLAASLLVAGLFWTPASAAQIGIGAVPEAATNVDLVQYGYGHRGHYGHRHRRGGYGGGRGYGKHYGQHHYHDNGFGRGGRGFRGGYGRRDFY